MEKHHVKPPPGNEYFDENGAPKVMRLLESYYSLRQSPSDRWYTTYEHLVKIGLKNLKLNPCVYIYSEDGIISNLTLYFDDV
ncbi:unnamed protein product, partial [Ascophyllum nodosum]